MKRKFCAFAIGCFLCLYFSSRSHSTTGKLHNGKRGTPAHPLTHFFGIHFLFPPVSIKFSFASAKCRISLWHLKVIFPLTVSQSLFNILGQPRISHISLFSLCTTSQKQKETTRSISPRGRTCCGNRDISISCQGII